MIMVTGGRCQGKTDLVQRLIEKGQICLHSDSAVDGGNDDAEPAFTAGIICHLELYIRRMMENGEDPEHFITELLLKNHDAVVIADEIGNGIVPADSFEREYREKTGRLCQRIASASDTVYRVIMGIGTKIKG